jgi:hypothetical protein
MVSIERQQQRWDKDETEQRRASSKRYTRGIPKRDLYALFRQARRKHEEAAGE